MYALPALVLWEESRVGIVKRERLVCSMSVMKVCCCSKQKRNTNKATMDCAAQCMYWIKGIASGSAGRR